MEVRKWKLQDYHSRGLITKKLPFGWKLPLDIGYYPINTQPSKQYNIARGLNGFGENSTWTYGGYCSIDDFRVSFHYDTIFLQETTPRCIAALVHNELGHPTTSVDGKIVTHNIEPAWMQLWVDEDVPKNKITTKVEARLKRLVRDTGITYKRFPNLHGMLFKGIEPKDIRGVNITEFIHVKAASKRPGTQVEIPF